MKLINKSWRTICLSWTLNFSCFLIATTTIKVIIDNVHHTYIVKVPSDSIPANFNDISVQHDQDTYVDAHSIDKAKFPELVMHDKITNLHC